MTRVFWVVTLALACAPQVPAPVNTDASMLMTVHAPRLPKQVAGIMGPIDVVVVERIVSADSIDALGAYVSLHRRIYIRAGLPLLFQWGVLAHEECHAALIDYGLGAIPMSLQQQICDAMGAARVAGLR